MAKANTLTVLPKAPQGAWAVLCGRRPGHAAEFRGGAKCIPAEDVFWLWYQHRWIQDGSLLRLMEKSRRVGISYGTAYDFTRSTALKGCRRDTWVSSRDLVSAVEFNGYCKTFAEALNVGAQDMGQQVLLDGGKGLTAQVLLFSNGKRICCLSGNPDAMASKGGNVALDEFALREDPRAAYGIAKPTITWGGRLSILSTHRGADNYFNKGLILPILERGNPMGWSHHKITLQDALDQGFLWKLQCQLDESDPRMEMDEAEYFDYERKSAADEETFLQEFMCVPASEDTNFISWEMIYGAEYGAQEPWEYSLTQAADAGRVFYGGVDIGRDQDLTVFWMAEEVGGVLFTRKILTLKKQTFTNQESLLWPWMRLCRRVCVDQTGIGRQFAERARERLGWKIEGVTFTSGMKEELAFPFRGRLEDRRWKMPLAGPVREHFRAIKKETTGSGNIRFAADRGENGHADMFWAAALCNHAAGKKEVALPISGSGGLGARRSLATAARGERGLWG